MPTAPGGYKTKDGKKVPSVTTIIGRFKESGGLIHWAWDLGMQGKDYREVRDDAAFAGTLAHAAVENFLQGKEEYTFEGDPDVVKKARVAYSAFRQWADQTQLKVTQTEAALVSEKYKFGGTLDAILVGGKRAMGDWKTSNRIYGEYLIQLAAYGKLWEENNPDEPIDGGFHLLRFDKEYGDFHAHWWGELDRAWRAFEILRELYDINNELKQRAA